MHPKICDRIGICDGCQVKENFISHISVWVTEGWAMLAPFHHQFWCFMYFGCTYYWKKLHFSNLYEFKTDIFFWASLCSAYYFFNILLFFMFQIQKFSSLTSFGISFLNLCKLKVEVFTFCVEVDVKKRTEKESLECGRIHIWALKTQKLSGTLSGPWSPATDSLL